MSEKKFYKFFRVLKEEYIVRAEDEESARKKLEEAEDLGDYQTGLFLLNDDENFYSDGLDSLMKFDIR